MRLVIFDFDDTLIDNTLLDMDSFRYVLDTFHLPQASYKTLIRWRKNGTIAKNIFRRIIKKKNNMLLEKCVSARLEYLARGGGGVKLANAKTGAKETLRQIKKNNNFIVVVSSRKDKSIIKKILKNLEMVQYIDEIYCAEDCKECLGKKFSATNMKIKLYKLALSDFKFNSDEKPLAIGNLKSDIVAARKSNMIPIAISGSYRFDSGISKKARTIKDLHEVLEIL
ncbi:MAG: HAD family hydrolase [Thaumarchaeota archaeon]|nr:HAD family hydrolase [Nitrososphaerota archaeon]